MSKVNKYQSYKAEHVAALLFSFLNLCPSLLSVLTASSHFNGKTFKIH